MRDRGCLLIFVKYPEKGKVKTRLARDLGDDTVLGLYQSFVLDLLQTVRATGHLFTICHDPPESRAEVVRWLGEDYSYLPQRGTDLGEKMANALADAFTAGFSRAVLIGSDIPDLTEMVINEAFESLNTEDAVLGPAADGGYYLIGFQRTTFLPDAFKGIRWGADTVFQQTVDILQRFGKKVHLLPHWRDVDTLDDLKDLFMRNRDRNFRKSRTISCIVENRILDIS